MIQNAASQSTGWKYGSPTLLGSFVTLARGLHVKSHSRVATASRSLEQARKRARKGEHDLDSVSDTGGG